MNQNEWRQKNFLDKFQAAASEFSVSSYFEIESLKFKDSANNRDYKELLLNLVVPRVEGIQGNYQGKAWKLTDTDDNSIIIVEHETGLEILYIAGSIASIIGLISLVINAWSRIRDHRMPFRDRFGDIEMEKRRFDTKNNLIEEPAFPMDSILIQLLLSQYERHNERISSLEAEVSTLKKKVNASSKKLPKSRQVKKENNS